MEQKQNNFNTIMELYDLVDKLTTRIENLEKQMDQRLPYRTKPITWYRDENGNIVSSDEVNKEKNN